MLHNKSQRDSTSTRNCTYCVISSPNHENSLSPATKVSLSTCPYPTSRLQVGEHRFHKPHGPSDRGDTIARNQHQRLEPSYEDLLNLHELLEMRMLQLYRHFSSGSTIGRPVHLCELHTAGMSALVRELGGGRTDATPIGCGSKSENRSSILSERVSRPQRNPRRELTSCPYPCAASRPTCAVASDNTGLVAGALPRSICEGSLLGPVQRIGFRQENISPSS